MAKKALVMSRTFGALREQWFEVGREHGVEVIDIAPATQEEYLKYFAENDVVFVANTWPDSRAFGGYTKDMIAKIGASGVKAIVHEGAGYDVLGDIEEWKKTKVEIGNCPNAPATATADTAVFLALGAMRNFYPSTQILRSGNWRGSPKIGRTPAGLTLGILGLGHIGQKIRDRLHPFGFKKTLYYQRSRLSPDLEKDSVFVPDIDEFLSTSDVVVVVVPLTTATHHLLNRERLLNVVKPNAVIVNVARGPVIDESALVEALDSGRVFSAGLDVYEREPEIHPGLLKNDNVLLLPHIGALSEQTMELFDKEVLDNFKSFLTKGKLLSPVFSPR